MDYTTWIVGIWGFLLSALGLAVGWLWGNWQKRQAFEDMKAGIPYRCPRFTHRWRRFGEKDMMGLLGTIHNIKQCTKCHWYKDVKFMGYGEVVYYYEPDAFEKKP